MKNFIYIPPSCRSAERHLTFALKKGPSALTKKEFVRGWCSLSFLYPGLHPDSFSSRGSGWPKHFKPLAAEAWRRAEAGRLLEDELYPSDAQWAGIYNRMRAHTALETERHLQIGAGQANPSFA